MPKKLLNCHQIRAGIQEMGSKGVPEGVDAEALMSCGLFQEFPDGPLNGSGGESPPSRVEEKGTRICTPSLPLG